MTTTDLNYTNKYLPELIEIQYELNAPKNRKNDFGNYKYRSLEDILEALKPLLKKYDTNLVISDEIVLIGDRYYVKATATFTNSIGKQVQVTAFARESLEKKGMDASQITGSASSYARKYAVSGLFAIDDEKDPDTNEYNALQKAGLQTKQQPKQQQQPQQSQQKQQAEQQQSNTGQKNADDVLSKVRKMQAAYKSGSANLDIVKKKCVEYREACNGNAEVIGIINDIEKDIAANSK